MISLKERHLILARYSIIIFAFMGIRNMENVFGFFAPKIMTRRILIGT